MSPEHIAHPYPTEQEKAQIMKETGIEMKQLTNWFVNNRKRYWKPRVEARLQQQANAAAAVAQAHAATFAAVTAVKQAHAVALAASNNNSNHDCGNDYIISSAVAANLVSPEAAFKPTMTVQPPAGNSFISFDLESPSKKLQQQLNQHHHLHHALSPAPLAAQLLSPTGLHRNESSSSFVAPSATTSARAVSEVSSSSNSSSVSVSASEGELSDTSPEDLDDAVVVTSLKKSPVKLVSMNNSYARNVSFCSLEQVTGEASGEESSSLNIRKEESTSCSSTTVSSKGDGNTLIPTAKTSTCKQSNKRLSSSSAVAPRKKYRRVSLDLWIDACRNAPHNSDESLPSLEEASRLFGYSK
jgi:hypothetical protein